MQTIAGKTTRRCPSCSSKMAADLAICPICGHESEPVIVDIAPRDDRSPPAPALAAPRPTFGRFIRGVIRRLPWGVIGVVIVIGGLVLGARAVLELDPSAIGVAPTITPTRTATSTRAPTNTPAPTATTPPTAVPIRPTPTVSPRATYVVRFGDTCGDIAEQFSLSVRELAAYNDISLLGGGCFIVEGASLRIPAPTPTAGPSPTLRPGETPRPTDVAIPTATLPPQLVYEVRPGDVCGIIAERFPITVRQIIAQNKLDEDCSISIGQKLTLNFATPTPASTTTPVVARTPTPRGGYSAPSLIGPQDGEIITGTTDTVALLWLSAGILREREWYVVQIQPAGAITVPIFETKATSLKISADILGGLDERSFAWWVQVKELVSVNPVTGARQYADLSPPSVARRFVWRRTFAPTPTPAP